MSASQVVVLRDDVVLVTNVPREALEQLNEHLRAKGKDLVVIAFGHVDGILDARRSVTESDVRDLIAAWLTTRDDQQRSDAS